MLRYLSGIVIVETAALNRFTLPLETSEKFSHTPSMLWYLSGIVIVETAALNRFTLPLETFAKFSHTPSMLRYLSGIVIKIHFLFLYLQWHNDCPRK